MFCTCFSELIKNFGWLNLFANTISLHFQSLKRNFNALVKLKKKASQLRLFSLIREVTICVLVLPNKNALRAALSLACLEIRSRNEETINYTRSRIYSLKVFYFLLYRRRYFLLVYELI